MFCAMIVLSFNLGNATQTKPGPLRRQRVLHIPSCFGIHSMAQRLVFKMLQLVETYTKKMECGITQWSARDEQSQALTHSSLPLAVWSLTLSPSQLSTSSWGAETGRSMGRLWTWKTRRNLLWFEGKANYVWRMGSLLFHLTVQLLQLLQQHLPVKKLQSLQSWPGKVLRNMSWKPREPMKDFKETAAGWWSRSEELIPCWKMTWRKSWRSCRRTWMCWAWLQWEWKASCWRVFPDCSCQDRGNQWRHGEEGMESQESSPSSEFISNISNSTQICGNTRKYPIKLLNHSGLFSMRERGLHEKE